MTMPQTWINAHARDRHVVVITDVHLHEGTSESTLDALTGLFTQYGDDGSSGEKKYTAILAGDFFDFPVITSLPDDQQALFTMNRRERKYGLDPTNGKTVWKIDRLAQRHRSLFAAMARFLASGNEVVFLPGNHDEELLLPLVRSHLRRLLSTTGQGAGRCTEAGFAKSIRFSPWFYYEPGLIYVEHGHFYDPDGVPPTLLISHESSEEWEIEPSLGRLVTRYLITRVPGYDYSNDLDMTPWPMLIQTFRTFGVHAPAAIYHYLAMAARVFTIIRQRNREKHPGHRASVEDIAGDLGIPKKHLEELLSLAAKPRIDSMSHTASRLYMDRVAAFATSIITVFASIPSLLSGISWVSLLPILPLSVLLFTMRTGNRFRGNHSAHCRDAARHIWDILRPPCIVMGHSHTADLIEMADGTGTSGTYINMGAFGDAGTYRIEGHPYLVVKRNQRTDQTLIEGLCRKGREIRCLFQVSVLSEPPSAVLLPRSERSVPSWKPYKGPLRTEQ